jgi:hypothetical protein
MSSTFIVVLKVCGIFFSRRMMMGNIVVKGFVGVMFFVYGLSRVFVIINVWFEI